MKWRIILVAALSAFMAGLLVPKERLMISVVSALELEAEVLEGAIGSPPYAVNRNEARRLLTRGGARERAVLGSGDGASYFKMWERLSTDPELKRAVGYPDGQAVRWLLLGQDGRVRISLSLPLLRDERC